MSGGSWDYLYEKVRDAAERLGQENETPLRVAFGRHLLLVAEALHAVEWVDSCDWSRADEEKPIRACLRGWAMAPGDVERLVSETRAILNETRRSLDAIAKEHGITFIGRQDDAGSEGAKATKGPAGET